VATDDGGYENQNVCFTNTKIEGNEELHEGNVFCNCIMLIHNFITVDGTGYLLLVMADKGG